MSMPNHLVFVRHGQSEANVVHGLDRDGEPHERADAVNRRPDWMHRLSAEGIAQARTAGRWINENLGGLESFHGRYVSPFLRTRETAAYISEGTNNDWITDDRVIERDWGRYGMKTIGERSEVFPDTVALHKESPWYTRLNDGESMADVYQRFRDFQATLHREESGEKVIVVSHGEFINVALYGLERMLPEEWADMDRNPDYTVKNCALVHFTRVNPEDETDVRDKINWRRIIYTDKPEASPDGGAWREIGQRRRFSSDELLGQLTIAPPILDRN